MPNHKVEIEKMNNTQEVYYDEDYASIVVIKSRKFESYWREYWYIFKKDSKNTAPEEVICDEMLYDPDILKNLIHQAGFEIREIYGDLFGSEFDRNTSWREVLVCVKKKRYRERL